MRRTRLVVWHAYNFMDDTNKKELAKNESQLFSVGGPLERAKVTLRVFGNELDPDEISYLLQCEPTSKARKGDIVDDDGKGHQRVSPIGKWSLHSGEPEDLALEEQVLKILSRVTEKREVWQRLTQQYKVDLFCGVFLNEGSWNRGFSLSPTILKELAARNLEIGFDIYTVHAASPRANHREPNKRL